MKITSPFNPAFTIEFELDTNVEETILRSNQSLKEWKNKSLDYRIQVITKFVDELLKERQEICEELSNLIGRPLSQNENEIKGFKQRAEALLKICKDSLKDTIIEDSPEFTKFISREALGVVFIISAWNYPYLISVNGILPALLAGNTVIFKHAPQTFSVGKRFVDAFRRAKLPDGVFQVVNCDHTVAESILKSPLVNFVHFTGSVKAGKLVNKLVAQGESLAGVGLELGGKDSAYVRADADPWYSAEQLVDGAIYNSGQSCCSVERIYVHESVYDQFLENCVKITMNYKLGNPLENGINLGPVIRIEAANEIKSQVEEAIAMGAVAHIPETLFPLAQKGSCFVAPQILTGVNHSMRLMTEETFGPVVGIMKVGSDDEAIEMMNDSQYGLTASIWTKNIQEGLELGKRLDTGTFYLNRCDYLDPLLPWVGIKSSGRGCTLSKYGFDQLTRPKSYHLKKLL